MGALACIRKRVDECFNVNIPSSSFSSIGSSMYLDSIDCRVFKKQKISLSTMHGSPTDKVASSRYSVVSRLSRYPKPEQPLKREPLGPTRRKFGFTWKTEFREDKGRTVEVGERGDMGNALSAKYRETKASAYEALCYAKESLGRAHKGKEKVVSEDSSIEEGWCVLDDPEGEFGDSGRLLLKNDGLSGIVWKMEVEAATAEKTIPVSSSKVLDQTEDHTEDHTEVEDTQIMIRSWSLSKENVAEQPQYRKLHKDATKRDPKLQHLGFQIDLILKNILLRGPVKEPKQEDSSLESFVPLTQEEEDEVEHAFKANRKKVLISHDDSNIQITREVLQCLRPGAWLNDEVINLYLELLKEREKREPNKFLKCHFFNTFFYKKLIGGKNSYDYKSVRRWTSQKKLGYSLNECEKIFVPVHQQVHWCLAVINTKDQKFQYLDSLGGRDPHVLNILAKYYVDEVKDKNALDINVSSWKHEYVKDLPGQENGSDCGVFMIKYIDFYSRGLMLQFSQEDMPYFRRRTAKEILRLRAD